MAKEQEQERDRLTVVALMTRNRCHALDDIILSVLGQQGHAVGILVFDNGSTDGTSAHLEKIKARFPNVVSISREAPQLRPESLAHEAYREAGKAFPSMRYFAWSDDSIYFLPNWLDQAFTLFCGHPQPMAVAPWILDTDFDGNVVDAQTPPVEANLKGPRDRELLRLATRPGARNFRYALYAAETVKQAADADLIGLFGSWLVPYALSLGPVQSTGKPSAVRLARVSETSKLPSSLKGLRRKASSNWLKQWLDTGRRRRAFLGLLNGNSAVLIATGTTPAAMLKVCSDPQVRQHVVQEV